MCESVQKMAVAESFTQGFYDKKHLHYIIQDYPRKRSRGVKKSFKLCRGVVNFSLLKITRQITSIALKINQI